MNFIITMAGLGSRFQKEGYNCPKYEIELYNGDTLFDLSIKSLINLVIPLSLLVLVISG